MRRREFVVLVGGAAAWPAAGVAQPKPMSAIGYLGIASPQAFASRLSAFRQGLSEFGYVDGQNLAFEYRWAETQYDRLPALAADLVGRKADLILASGPPAAHAAKGATATVPIVFVVGSDPVRDGLVASLARPGGNITGISILAVDLSLKRLDLLSELMPQVRTIGLLTNPTNAAESRVVAEVREAALARGYELHSLTASTDKELEDAFATLAQIRAGTLFVSPDSFFTSRRNAIVALANRHAVPAIYSFREYALHGGLMSYAPNLEAVYTQAGRYAGRILRGESPANLPVQQPTVLELVINLKTAKDLRLEIPSALLARADEVIE